MTADDVDFMRWATGRHGWIWRLGFGEGPARRGRLRSLLGRRAAAFLAVQLVRLDRLAWSLGYRPQ